jgi:hypothetical protein
MGRHETLERIRKGEITVTDAAKLLGVSRTRVNQLLKKQPSAKPVAPAAPSLAPFKVVSPDPEPSKAPAPPPPAADPAAAPPTGPVDLKSVLEPVAPAAAPGVTPVNAVPIDGVDPDDADAGRELLGWLRRGVTEFAARFVYKAKADDPRLEKLKEENKFLKVALKRNSDKAAPLGWFTKGWVGLAVGFGIEFIRVAMTFPPVKEPAAPPVPKPVEEAPTAPPVTTVDQVREQAEASLRPSIEERIRMSQGR